MNEKEEYNMTPERFYNEMKIISKAYKDDKEAVHMYMDDFMCDLLRELGYEKGVEVFENTPKWYA